MKKQLAQTASVTAFVLSLLAGNTFGVTVDLNPAKDNTLYESFTGSLSNGAGPGFFAGVTGFSGPGILRGLIMFDIANEIPASATITSAALTLNVSAAANSSFSDAIVLTRAAVDWGEGASIADLGVGGGGAGGAAQTGDATWTHSFSPNTSWSNFGGDFTGVISASTGVAGTGSYSWSDTQLTADIQDMLDTPNGNFGWFVLGNESSPETAKRFDSRESSSPPVLTIEYDLAGGGLDADFDGDEDVDGEDLDDWQSAYGSGDGGDADGDSDTDGSDYLAWQQQFTGLGTLQTTAVPEPSTAVLSLGLLAFAALNRRVSDLRP